MPVWPPDRNVRSKGINRNKLKWLLEQPVDVKLEILGHHLELCRLLINEILDEEVTRFSGERYSHQKPHNGRYSPVWPAGQALGI